MRLLIVTDAWAPQVNGVVRTLTELKYRLEARGHQVSVISPDQFRSVPCPTYPDIRLALAGPGSVVTRIKAARPDAIHIATEGPLGVSARRWCVRSRVPFTTAYHTKFPEYAAMRTRLPPSLFWRYIRWFHGPSRGILVATESVARELHAQGLPQTRRWGRGVDLSRFRPDAPAHPALADLPRPVALYVGRVAVEKNVEAFLCARHAGSKVVVGDGPALASLKARHPDVRFLGALGGEALAGAYAAADLFVFPSRTDTFGLVMVEALASGTPVAAFPVPGPLDVLDESVGAMDEDLGAAMVRALRCDRQACAAYARDFSWDATTTQFLSALEPLGPMSAPSRPAAVRPRAPRLSRARSGSPRARRRTGR